MFGTSLKLCCFWLAIRGCDCRHNYNFLIATGEFQVGFQIGKQNFTFFLLVYFLPGIPIRCLFLCNSTTSTYDD